MKELKETHQKGTISIENIGAILGSIEATVSDRPHVTLPIGSMSLDGDFGIQVAKDGRVWICINEIAFIRFKPEGMGFGEVLTHQEVNSDRTRQDL